MYRDVPHPTRNRCASPPLLQLDQQPILYQPRPEIKVDQTEMHRRMFGNKWDEVKNSPAFNNTASSSATTETKREDNSFGFGMGTSSYFQSSYSSMLGGNCMFPMNPMAEYIRNRNAKRAAEEAAKKAPWKFDPPTFQFGQPYKQPHEEKKTEELNENGKMPKEEEEEEEWIQSPFCGQRYRKKDVDLLVAFADKYIKAECESAKRRKLEEKEAVKKEEAAEKKEEKDDADEKKEESDEAGKKGESEDPNSAAEWPWIL